MDCFPHAESLSPEEQLSFICNLKLSPDAVINLKVSHDISHVVHSTHGTYSVHAYIHAYLLQIPDQDLEVRRVEQRVDPLSNEVFVRSVFSPKDKKVERDEDNGDEEEEEEEIGETGEGSDTQGKDLFDEDLVRHSVLTI